MLGVLRPPAPLLGSRCWPGGTTPRNPPARTRSISGPGRHRLRGRARLAAEAGFLLTAVAASPGPAVLARGRPLEPSGAHPVGQRPRLPFHHHGGFSPPGGTKSSVIMKLSGGWGRRSGVSALG